MHIVCFAFAFDYCIFLNFCISFFDAVNNDVYIQSV